MKTYQFWLLFITLVIGLGSISAELAKISYQTKEIFGQARWMTWKMDQDGSTRIKVDAER